MSGQGNLFGSADWRYQHDASFHALVTQLEHMLLALQFTPSEIREAAMYAAYRVEMRRPAMVVARLDALDLELKKGSI